MIKYLLSCVLIFSLSCTTERMLPEVHYIKKDYTGPVVILFDVKDADSLVVDEGRLIYNIPENGYLKTSSSINSGKISKGKLKFYYFDGEDKILLEGPITRPISSDLKENKMYVVLEEIGSFNAQDYLAYFISLPKDFNKNISRTKKAVARISR